MENTTAGKSTATSSVNDQTKQVSAKEAHYLEAAEGPLKMMSGVRTTHNRAKTRFSDSDDDDDDEDEERNVSTPQETAAFAEQRRLAIAKAEARLEAMAMNQNEHPTPHLCVPKHPTPPLPPTHSAPSSLILFGDSITQASFTECGFGAHLSNLYARRLDVLNRGFSGYNTRWAKHYLPDIFPTTTKAALIMVFFGANDASLVTENPRQHVPVDEYGDNLRDICHYVQHMCGHRLLLVTNPPVDHGKRLLFQQQRYGGDIFEQALFWHWCCCCVATLSAGQKMVTGMFGVVLGVVLI
jgi:hypothetical protein